jgi:hypothetical protein
MGLSSVKRGDLFACVSRLGRASGTLRFVSVEKNRASRTGTGRVEANRQRVLVVIVASARSFLENEEGATKAVIPGRPSYPLAISRGSVSASREGRCSIMRLRKS